MPEPTSLADNVAGSPPSKGANGVSSGALLVYTDFARKRELDDTGSRRYNASVFYLNPSAIYDSKGQKPYFMNIPVDPKWAPKVKQTNVSYTRKVVAVTDVRNHEDLFSLDRHGFALGRLETSLAYDDFSVPGTVTSRFYNEVKDFLKQATGAAEVLPFDFQVRRNDPSLPAGSRGVSGKAQPFSTVHGDQTATAAIRRLKYFHPVFAEKYAKSRFQIINVWKPLRGPVYDSPLAVCDYRTVRKEDLVPTDIIFPDYLGETYNFRPSPNHRFYYIDGQEAHEAWMVKCFDSATRENPEIAQFAPHVSFPYTKPGLGEGEVQPLRESVEVRSFVFHA